MNKITNLMRRSLGHEDIRYNSGRISSMKYHSSKNLVIWPIHTSSYGAAPFYKCITDEAESIYKKSIMALPIKSVKGRGTSYAIWLDL